jgi:hypothetical protein
MNCRIVMDKMYSAAGGEPLPLLARLEIAAHLFFCRRCTGEFHKLEAAQGIMRTDFFPPSPDFEETLAARVFDEGAGSEAADAPTGTSFRGWVITGFIVLISLSTAFLGLNFTKVADAQGPSFLLPVGLTIGAVLTGYGAIFIASHLKELSSRFRLH